MKSEWKRSEKGTYLPGESPEIICVPPFRYYVISGKGDPNGPEFGNTVAALYAMSYGIKMMKMSNVPEGYFEYAVYPLEAVWTLDSKPGSILNKDELVYNAMIRQPDFVTESVAADNVVAVSKKKPNPMNETVVFETIDEGLCVQMTHVGTYDEESRSFAMMDEFCVNEGLERIGHEHREIYLSDPRRTSPEKLRTVLRYKVRRV